MATADSPENTERESPRPELTRRPGGKSRVLIVDDDRGMCEMMSAALGRLDFEVTWTVSPDDVMARIEGQDFDVIVADFNMPVFSGVELCQRIVSKRDDIPVVVITAYGSLDSAVAAIRAGAYDFVTKPFEMPDIALTLERAVRHRALKEELKHLRRAVKDSQTFEEMIGASPSMEKVYDLLTRVAETDATVLISGESGTGKELVARALHKRSNRAAGPFVAVNCAAVPEPLLESELFGHVKGAFTDARSARTGLFVRATGGILFLDEIGEMPMGMQTKLLRALQERTVRPVGGEQEMPFDSRIVAATNRDLEVQVEEHRFREDLYYRVNVVHIPVPPLRARGSDVLLLAQHFLKRFAAGSEKRVVGLSSAAAERLLAYAWPGNVRELQNCIERAVALARFDTIGVDDLPETVRESKRSHAVVVEGEDPSELMPMEEVERRYILRVLEAVGGSKKLAARILGLDRRTLYRKLERYNAQAEGRDVKARGAASASPPPEGTVADGTVAEGTVARVVASDAGPRDAAPTGAARTEGNGGEHPLLERSGNGGVQSILERSRDDGPHEAATREHRDDAPDREPEAPLPGPPERPGDDTPHDAPHDDDPIGGHADTHDEDGSEAADDGTSADAAGTAVDPALLLS